MSLPSFVRALFFHASSEILTLSLTELLLVSTI